MLQEGLVSSDPFSRFERRFLAIVSALYFEVIL